MREITREAPRGFGKRRSTAVSAASNAAVPEKRGPIATALLVTFLAVIGWLLRPGPIRTPRDGGGLDGSSTDASDGGGDGGGD